jgi:hypothetical protein
MVYLLDLKNSIAYSLGTGNEFNSYNNNAPVLLRKGLKFFAFARLTFGSLFY